MRLCTMLCELGEYDLKIYNFIFLTSDIWYLVIVNKEV